MPEMSDENVPSQEPSEMSATGEAPTSSEVEEPRSRNIQSPDAWRIPYGDQRYPEFAWGKTAEELANLTNKLYGEQLRGTQSTPQYQSAPQYQAPSAPPEPSSDDWLTDPGSAAKRQMESYYQSHLAPQLQMQAAALGATSRSIVAQQEPEAFRKWGPEIDALINQIDPQYRTTDAIGKVVNMVKGEHLDELVQERTKREIDRMANADPMRTDGSPLGATANARVGIDLDNTVLPPEYKRQLDKYGVRPETIDEFLTATEVRRRGITLDQARKEWLEKAGKGDIITEEAIRL